MIVPTATSQQVNLPAPSPVSALSIEEPGCPPLQTSAGTPVKFEAAGALEVAIPARALDYPSELMPNNVPHAPYQISASAVNNFAPNPPVNPSLSIGYFFEVCNQTSAPHTLTSLHVIIDSFTPSSGPTNVWHLCDNGVYDAATKKSLGGCGGGVDGMLLTATLTRNGIGASAPATGLQWPATIAANKAITFYVGVNGLANQGTYALSFTFSVAGASPTRVAPSDGSFLIAPSATVWTGTACQTPAMLAQIPTSSQDVYYVCPPAA
jgi:hypothetical protein